MSSEDKEESRRKLGERITLEFDEGNDDDDGEEEEEEGNLSECDEEYVEEEVEEEGEESASEPECHCESWDDDCRVINIKNCQSVSGFHLLRKYNHPMETENPAKRIRLSSSPKMRSDLLHDQVLTNFQKNISSNDVEIINEPFKVCVVKDFVQNTQVFKNLKEELQQIRWNVRSMDLYEFFQSADLKHLENLPSIKYMYEFLQNDVMNWVKKLTGFDLTHVSATFSFYGDTDYLLVHDDLRGNRKVAFILYLTEDGWHSGKGGALELFAKDECGHPSIPVREILPVNNQLLFFPVTNCSYHQVAEVTCTSDYRLSINGWFHTKDPQIVETPDFQPYQEGLFSETKHAPCESDIDLRSWIDNKYLNSNIKRQIREEFEETSEICLNNFLTIESFTELSEILQHGGLMWERLGPPNRLNYEVIRKENIPEVLNRFLTLFQSRQFFSVLKHMTSLEVTSVRLELQRWTPGSYTLLGDYSWYDNKELDLIMAFGCGDISDVTGGRTQYVSIDEQVQSALMTVDPEPNNLNILYRDTARFTKYFSKQSRCKCFYWLICSYETK